MMGETNRVDVDVPGIVPPALVETLKRGIEGTVHAGGMIDLEDRDMQLRLRDPTAISPGTTVYIQYWVDSISARPIGVRQNEKRRKRRELKEKARERLKDWHRRRAGEFWDEYDIPVEYDVAHKGRWPELLPGSSGTGINPHSVEHLYVLEGFDVERLQRDADSYLCYGNEDFEFDGVRYTDSDDEEYIPQVTCTHCLRLMERWK